MNKNIKMTIAGLALISSSLFTTIEARENKTLFAGMDYVFGNYSDSQNDGDATFIVGRFGWFIEESFSVEGRIGLGFEDDKAEDDTTLNSLQGIYGAYHFSRDDIFNPYLLGGYTKTDGVYNNSTDETDFSYGIGANFKIGNTFNLNIGWTSYTQDVDGVSLGFNFRF